MAGSGKHRTMVQAVILAALALLPAVAMALWHPNRPAWSVDALREGEVALSTVLAWQADREVLWLDTRSSAEHEAAAIPGALPLNEDGWEEQMTEFLAVWQPEAVVVVYCDDAACGSSHAVAGRLREQIGLDEVWVLHGGWAAWRDHSSRFE